MSKTITDIKWILQPIWMPCMACKTEQSTKEVVLDGVYHYTICGDCSQMSEHGLKAKLFRKAVK